MTGTYDDAFYDKQAAGSATSARVVLPLVFAKYGLPGSVVDVGCGIATWLSVARELGVAVVTGVDNHDAAPGRLLVPAEDFRRQDLEASVSLPRRYDLALSLEVAEHLSAARAEGFVADLCALSDRVLFSAAIPGQLGDHHINERWQSWWGKLFAARGYVPDDFLREQLWNHPSVMWWYAQNTILYRRDPGPPRPVLDVVHPRCHEQQVRLGGEAQARLRQVTADLLEALKKNGLVSWGK
ncbi:MAG: methyltransferase domain-containing protein [Rhodocyclaceae bacterium]|nr:methyltransferase domain-containing protein [Rhodocyclaceae bacterium]